MYEPSIHYVKERKLSEKTIHFMFHSYEHLDLAGLGEYSMTIRKHRFPFGVMQMFLNVQKLTLDNCKYVKTAKSAF